MKFVLGISGYIGSGKSEAGKVFKEMGAHFIDADVIVSRIYEKGGSGYMKIVNFFGDEFLTKDGTLNRKKLGRFVFSDINKLKILNGLIHPLVAREIKKEISTLNDGLIVVEAVYIDGELMGGIINRQLWVECDGDNIYRRAIIKGKYDMATINKIYDIQKELKIRPKRPHYVLDNNESRIALKKQVKSVWDKLNGY